MPYHRLRRTPLPARVARALAALGLATAVLASGGPAAAAISGSIDFVGEADGAVQVIYGLGGGGVADLDSLEVTYDGQPVEASAELATDSAVKVRRTTVLAFDVSLSMRRDGKFAAAKSAAETFLAQVPDDVNVGIVTFAGKVAETQAPTTDRDELRRAVADLALANGTRLYDGVLSAVEAAGAEGSRSVLVLSDGRDTSGTALDDVTTAVADAEVGLDVVALGQQPKDVALLKRLADAGRGQVLPADDPSALADLFAAQAEVLAQQVQVTFTPPDSLAGSEGTLAVSLDVDGEPTADRAFVTLPRTAPEPGGGEAGTPLPASSAGPEIPRGVMFAGLAAAALAAAALLIIGLGGLVPSAQQDLETRIEAYTRKGARKLAAKSQAGLVETPSVTRQAVAMADKVLEGNQGFESALGARLESAGLQLKPAEWLLMHAGVTLGAGVVAALVSGSNLLVLGGALIGGVLVPWLYLRLRRGRRLKAFKAQMADTLQLMAGSLSAGLSLAQSVSTVVKEGAEPMAGEFRRAMMETRLGVSVEEALLGVAQRMQSRDFEWVVMAIRIQREVGGNLSELLNTVADTIREREYLERQVLALSAEGRLSVWILGGLPPGFMAYLLMANPSYLLPMYTTPLGWVMLIVMAIMLTVGILWMKKLVKVTV